MLIESRLVDSQIGFSKGRGSRDGICQLRIMAERFIEKKKKLFDCWQSVIYPMKRLH